MEAGLEDVIAARTVLSDVDGKAGGMAPAARVFAIAAAEMNDDRISGRSAGYSAERGEHAFETRGKVALDAIGVFGPSK